MKPFVQSVSDNNNYFYYLRQAFNNELLKSSKCTKIVHFRLLNFLIVEIDTQKIAMYRMSVREISPQGVKL